MYNPAMAELKQELINELQAIANSEKALLLSFIAPSSIIRTSPASIDYAEITLKDLYKIEKRIEQVETALGSLPKKLHLIIHTPGGDLYTATKIAIYLQKLFGSKIQAFVPYEAASGGTIMCLAAKSIVMDTISNLTPIDPQVSYKGQRISVTTYEQAIKDFKKEYENLRPEELPSPSPQMANQFDPIIAKEMNRKAWDMLNVAYQLLVTSQGAKTEAEKKKLYAPVFELGNSDRPHSHVISADEARSFGLNIDTSSESLTLLKLYKKWVSAKLDEKIASHIIDIYYPMEEKEEGDEQEQTA